MNEMTKTEILQTEFVTHDVKRFVVKKPRGFRFEPGQAVKLSLDTGELRHEQRPFTPTSLPEDEILEFTIKRYPERDQVTEALHKSEPGDPLLMSNTAFGTITYRGPGVFIAGGAGLTPLLAIIRKLDADGELKGHTLVFSNDTPRDVICEKELRNAFGERCFLTCTRESGPGYDHRRVDRDYLSKIIGSPPKGKFYICGPPEFVGDVKGALRELGVPPDDLVFEQG